MHMHVSHTHSMNTGSSSPQWFTALTMTSLLHHFNSLRHWNFLNQGLILWAQQCEGVHIRLWTNSKTWPYTSYVSMIDLQCLNEPYIVSKATKATFSVDMSLFFSFILAMWYDDEGRQWLRSLDNCLAVLSWQGIEEYHQTCFSSDASCCQFLRQRRCQNHQHEHGQPYLYN